jgi:predicted DsbA family dithiol-disulfide isomerase
MPDAAACLFFFDFVDPLSYLVDLSLDELEREARIGVERVGCELRPPPSPLTRPSDPLWAERWEAVRRAPPAVALEPPPLVPWTRKAHELLAFGRSRGVGDPVRRGIFEAYFGRGRDIGRVDELVDVAAAAGLDPTEARAALDVDAHLDDVLEARRRAERAGLLEIPALLVGRRLVQGFHNLGDLSTLLGGPPGGGR